MKKHLDRKCELLSIIFLCTIGFLFFGCALTESYFDRKKPTEFQEGDKIAVIINTSYYLQSSPKEQTILNCISEGFKKLEKEIKIVPPRMFRSIAFSDINLIENFSTKKAIELININPSTVEKIKSIGIRYIVLVGEPDDEEFVIHKDFSWEWVGGAPYGAWLFYHTEKKASETISIQGEIFDMEYYYISGKISSSCSAESYYNILWSPIPIGFGWPSMASESKACKEFGEAVAKFIAGQETNECDTTPSESPPDAPMHHF